MARMRINSGRECNGRIYLCVYPNQDSPRAKFLTRETRDRCDRAHNQRDDDGLLVPAVRLNGQARPRRYPPGQITGRGLGVDSMFDELYERQRRLDDEFGGVDGVSYDCGGRINGGTISAVSQLERLSGGDAHRARAMVERRTSREQ